MSADGDDTDAKLDERLAAVPRDVPPTRDLWPGIAARLEPRTAEELETLGAGERARVDGSDGGASGATRFGGGARRGTLRRWPYALAASFAALAVAVLVALAVGLRAPGGAPVQAANDAVPAAGTSGERGGLLSAAFEAPQDERYRATRVALEQSFREGLAVLAPETRTRIEQNLELIRKANADIRAALAADPNSPLLLQLLESTWQQEIDLYTTVSRNSDPALARNET